jgi:hypothetical protein
MTAIVVITLCLFLVILSCEDGEGSLTRRRRHANRRARCREPVCLLRQGERDNRVRRAMIRPKVRAIERQ